MEPPETVIWTWTSPHRFEDVSPVYVPSASPVGDAPLPADEPPAEPDPEAEVEGVDGVVAAGAVATGVAEVGVAGAAVVGGVGEVAVVADGPDAGAPVELEVIGSAALAPCPSRPCK
jgi:hypothetical protein